MPTGVNCLFSPLQISGGQSSTLTLATTGAIVLLQPGRPRNFVYALILPLPMVGLLLMSTRSRRLRRPRLLGIWAFLLLIISLAACGTDPNPVRSPAGNVTPPGVYTVIVVGTNAQNQVVASTPVSFTVH
jgi:hypothetical protein